MPADSDTLNPFNDAATAPLATRERLAIQLRQHLTDPVGYGAALLRGREHIGKSCQLRQFRRESQDISFGVMIPLAEITFTDEDDLLTRIAEATAQHIVDYGYVTVDTVLLPENAPPDDDGPTPSCREWLRDAVLPQCIRYIRNQRRLVWMFDDVDVLIDAITNERIPADLPAYLADLLSPQLAMVMTRDLRDEDHIDFLRPLVKDAGVYRLSTLTQAEVSVYLRSLPRYLFPDEVVTAIYRLTGGEPVLLNDFAQELYTVTTEEIQHFDENAVKRFAATIYPKHDSFFRDMWNALPRNERLVLTAMSSRQYSAPTMPITTTRIATWLAEVDLPLDDISVNAALRGLEYNDVIDRKDGQIIIRARMMQQWLLEHAQISPNATATGATLPGEAMQGLVWWIVGIGVGLALLIGVVAAITQSDTADTGSPVPTVTLSPNTGE